MGIRNKKVVRSRIFRYGCPMMILSNRQKGGEGVQRPPPHALRGRYSFFLPFSAALLIPYISIYLYPDLERLLIWIQSSVFFFIFFITNLSKKKIIQFKVNIILYKIQGGKKMFVTDRFFLWTLSPCF